MFSAMSFLQLNNKFSWFYNDGNIFLTTYLKAFDFIKGFDLNSNSNNLFGIVPTKVFLDDLLMFLCILPIPIIMSKSFSSGLILINLQSNYFFIAFCQFFRFISVFASFFIRKNLFIIRKVKFINLAQNRMLEQYFLVCKCFHYSC